MTFIALYRNTSNELCTVLKGKDYLIVCNQRKTQVHSFYNVLIDIANDFKEMIETNKRYFKVTSRDVEHVQDYCNYSNAFLSELKRLGYEIEWTQEKFME